MALQYSTYHFDDLSSLQLYAILQLRQQVFIIEQDCIYQDCDDKDQTAYHVIGIDGEGKILATARILAPGVSYDDYASIGRIVTHDKIRGQGEGKKLTQYCIEKTQELYPGESIKISGQSWISPLYEKLGFTKVGEEYLEDGIPHVPMVLYGTKGQIA
jgi:ElaA protein